MFAGGDMKHKPQINECEINPHLLFDPAFQERHAFEREQGITPKCKFDREDTRSGYKRFVTRHC